MMSSRRWAITLLVAHAARAAAQAKSADAAPNRQGQTFAVLTLHVTDTLHQPISGADVALSRADSGLIVVGRTEAAGQYRVSFSATAPTYTLSVRHVGYRPVQRAIHIQPGDTLSLPIALARGAPSLDTIRVTERELPRARIPYLDAAEIAASPRSVVSLGDAILKLRPELDYHASLMCHPRPHLGPFSRGPYPVPRTERMKLGGIPRQAEVYVNGELFTWAFDPWFTLGADAIADMRFVNCFDSTVAGLPAHPWPSVYITLKPGYDWDYKRGTFRVDSGADSIERP